MIQLIYLLVLCLSSFGLKAMTVQPANKCVPPNDQPITPISTIQSEITDLKNDVSPLLGKIVWVEAVVSLSKQGMQRSDKEYDSQYKGYWLQEQKKDYDNNSQTSEALFVFDAFNKVKAGDQIIIQAKVGEYYQVTQLQSVKTIIRCAKNQAIEPVKLVLPVKNLLVMEAVEGMLIELDSLIVSDFYGTGFALENYGQMVLSSKLQFVPTELKPVLLAEYQNAVEVFKHDRIILDDGSFELKPSYIPYPDLKGLSISNALVVGMNVESFIGVKHGFKQHNIVVPKSTVSFDPYQPQNIKAIADSSNIKIAYINLKNHFNGEGEDKHFPTKRGAKTKKDFLIQQTKLVEVLVQSNTDIIALVEIENDGFKQYSAIVELVSVLNRTQSDENQYTYIQVNPSSLNSDAITQGFLYRPNKVKLLGRARWVDLNHNKNQFKVRPALKQSFDIGGEALTIVLSHFKSRRGKCAEDKNIALVEGNCYSVRLRSAQIMTEHLKDSDESIILLGDLNAYSKELALRWFVSNGFVNGKYTSLYKQGIAYTYSYNGLLGSLDHVLFNEKAKQKINTIVDWHINSVAPALFGLELNKNEKLHNVLRSSDHDLILIELRSKLGD